jgi:uncharacterized protein YjeT (DUF2065 family)
MKLFFMALGLLCVFEGLLPFLAPRVWRHMIQNMMMQSDKTLRIFGLIGMLVGLAILYSLR